MIAKTAVLGSLKFKKKIARLQTNKIGYELQEASSGEPQISTTDKDARALLVQGGSRDKLQYSSSGG
jgi:hypothetical protein